MKSAGLMFIALLLGSAGWGQNQQFIVKDGICDSNNQHCNGYATPTPQVCKEGYYHPSILDNVCVPDGYKQNDEMDHPWFPEAQRKLNMMPYRKPKSHVVHFPDWKPIDPCEQCVGPGDCISYCQRIVCSNPDNDDEDCKLEDSSVVDGTVTGTPDTTPWNTGDTDGALIDPGPTGVTCTFINHRMAELPNVKIPTDIKYCDQVSGKDAGAECVQRAVRTKIEARQLVGLISDPIAECDEAPIGKIKNCVLIRGHTLDDAINQLLKLVPALITVPYK